MEVTRTWFVDRDRHDVVFRMNAYISGRQFAAEIRQGGHGRDTPMPPPYIEHALRKQVMGVIERGFSKMTEPKTYKLNGITVRVEKDADTGLQGASRACAKCAFGGQGMCPPEHEEIMAGLKQSCVEGDHHYVKVH